ncbi:MAG: hypothetical protein IT204_03180 [Fimbriimonadaceae bacterium]|nr:hypothetical protein [Fimbriimonadaceae bacterium]
MAQAPVSAADPPVRQSAVTLRAILLGLLLMPPNVYWCLQVEGIWHSGHPSALSLFWNVCFTILVLVAINLGLKRIAPRWALTQGEFITIYVLLYMATALAGHDSLQLQIPVLSMPWYFADDSNKYATLLQPFLPEWLTVSNPDVVKAFIEGHNSLFDQGHWRFWVIPIFWWTAFIAALGLVLICLNVFVRRQWTEHEKLSYPIIQLPLALTEGGGQASFFTNKWFLAGFVAVAALDILNGLSRGFIPALPYIKIRHNEHVWSDAFTTFPWNRMGRLETPFYPFLVALGFFLPLDLSFSIWFFFLFQKAQNVLAAVVKLPDMPELPYSYEQTAGALLVLFIYTVWLARGHLSAVARTIFTRHDRLDDRNEPVSYRTAFAGLLVGSAFLYWFSLRAGMSPGVIVAFFIIYGIIAFTITRIRAELGPPAHEMVGVNAYRLLITFQGTAALGPKNLIMYPLYYWFTGRGYRTQIMPPMMEGFKMAERAGVSSRGLGWVMLLGLYVGGIAVYLIGAQLSFTNNSSFNGMVMHSHGHVKQTATWIEGLAKYDVLPNVPRMIALAAAMVFTAFLMFMRLNSLRWPFHPAGYALSMTFGVDYFWMCMLLAWALKSLVLKYGGYGLYRKVLPLCYGVLLGEYVVGAFWSVLSLFLHRPIYDFSPG